MKVSWGSGGIAPRILWPWHQLRFTPRPLYLQGKSLWYPLYRRLGGPQSRSGRGGEEKNSQPETASVDRERLVSWSIAMVENPVVGPKFRPFSIHNISIFQHKKRGWLALWIEVKVNTFDIEGSDEHCLHLWFQHGSFRGSWGCRQCRLRHLLSGSYESAMFYLSDKFWQEAACHLTRNFRTHISAPVSHFATRYRNHTFYHLHNFHTTGVNALKS
jgi:hypothetical protein